MIKHTHINMWAECGCRAVGMHPLEAAVPGREPSLNFREINNSPALVYFFIGSIPWIFPSARIAEDFSISIYIPSPEFLIWFSRCWGPTKQARSSQAWSCCAEQDSGVCGVTVWLTFGMLFPIFCSPVSMEVGMISVNKESQASKLYKWGEDL